MVIAARTCFPSGVKLQKLLSILNKENSTCRTIHTNREARSGIAKLSPQEFISPIIWGEFTSPTCTSGGWSCYDCYTRKFCMSSSGNPWDKRPCLDPLTNNQYPYCDPKSNQCVSYEPEGCESITKFECIREDIFPDIQNCTRYFSCKDDEVETLTCDSTQYFKSIWGKCVYKIKESDCEKAKCSLTTQIHELQSDPTLYYQCKDGIPTLKGCKSNTQYLDITSKTCNSICNEKTIGLIPNTRDCTSYYKCSFEHNEYNIDKLLCDRGMGFDSIEKRCVKKYDRLCNELAILENDVEYLFGITSFTAGIYSFIKSILRFFKCYPLTLLLSVGLSDDTVSMVILIVNYLIRNRGIPPAVIRNLINVLLGFLPDQLQSVINMILDNIPMFKNAPLVNTANLADKLSNYIESALANLQFDPIKIMQLNSVNEIIRHFKEDIIRISGLSEENLPLILEQIKPRIPTLLKNFNEHVGTDIFNINGNIVRVIPEGVSNFVGKQLDAWIEKMLEYNPFLAQILEEGKRLHWGEIEEKLRQLTENIQYQLD